MPINVEIEGKFWKAFPDDVEKSVIDSAVRQETERRYGMTKEAAQDRFQPAIPQIAPSIPQALSNQPELRLEENTPVPTNPQTPAQITGESKAGAIRAAQYGLPMAGAMIGGGAAALPALSRMVPSVARFMLPSLGAGVGTGVSEVATKGKTRAEDVLPPMMQEAILQAAPGLAGRLFGASARLGARHTPGGIMETEIAAQKQGINQMERLGEKIAGPSTEEVGRGYNQWRAGINPTGWQHPMGFNLSHTTQTAQDVAQDLNVLIGYFREKGEESIVRTIQSLPSRMDPRQFQVIYSKLGEVAEDMPKPAVSAAKRLHGAMKADLHAEALRGNTQAEELEGLNVLYRRGRTRDKLQDLASKGGVKERKVGTEIDPVLVKQNLLRSRSVTGRDLTERFHELHPEEQRAIMSELDSLKDIPKIAGTPGSSWRPILWGAGAGTLGSALGGVIGGYPGLVVGGGVAAGAGGLLSRYTSTPSGRELVLKVMKNKLGEGRFSQVFGAGFGEATRSQETSK